MKCRKSRPDPIPLNIRLPSDNWCLWRKRSVPSKVTWVCGPYIIKPPDASKRTCSCRSSPTACRSPCASSLVDWCPVPSSKNLPRSNCLMCACPPPMAVNFSSCAAPSPTRKWLSYYSNSALLFPLTARPKSADLHLRCRGDSRESFAMNQYRALFTPSRWRSRVSIGLSWLKFMNDRRENGRERTNYSPLRVSRNSCRVVSGAIPGTTMAVPVRFQTGAGSRRSSRLAQCEINTGGDFTTRPERRSRKV